MIPITDEMVEAGTRALCQSWDGLPGAERKRWRLAVRAVLTAALQAVENTRPDLPARRRRANPYVHDDGA